MESARGDLAQARRARAAFYTAETERRLLRQRHRSGGIQTVIATTRLAVRATHVADYLLAGRAMWRWIIEYTTACSDRTGRSGAATARLLCFSGAGFTDGLAAEANRVGACGCLTRRSLRNVATGCAYPADLVSSAASDCAAFSSSGAWPTRSR
jgi:hypothetical protein